MRFLQTIGHTEIKFGEFGIVVAEAGIEYFAELFHGDIISISISIDNISRVAFDCYYKIEKKLGQQTIIAACIKTNMVCYDYKEKKVRSIPEDIKNKSVNNEKIAILDNKQTIDKNTNININITNNIQNIHKELLIK
jgi:acyl-CoA thioesterase FadM